MTLRSRRAVVVALLTAVLLLTGCGGLARDDVDAMAKIKQKCEDAGGEFHTWLSEGPWLYECDLSTNPEEQR